MFDIDVTVSIYRLDGRLPTSINNLSLSSLGVGLADFPIFSSLRNPYKNNFFLSKPWYFISVIVYVEYAYSRKAYIITNYGLLVTDLVRRGQKYAENKSLVNN